jgi:hypothetical protein
MEPRNVAAVGRQVWVWLLGVQRLGDDVDDLLRTPLTAGAGCALNARPTMIASQGEGWEPDPVKLWAWSRVHGS